MTKTRQRGVVPLNPPWEPPLTGLNEHHAIRALYEGNANADQQREVIAWLMRCTGIAEMTFRPGLDGDRSSAFAEGKRHVGRMFFDLARTSPGDPSRT